MHKAAEEPTHQLALSRMRLRWRNAGPCLNKHLERLTSELWLTLQKAVEASITAFLRSVTVADGTHQRDVIAHDGAKRTGPRWRFAQCGKRLDGVRGTGRAKYRCERSLAVPLTELCQGVMCFIAALHEILEIPVDLACPVVDHDLGHLGQALSDPLDDADLCGAAIRRSPRKEAIESTDLVCIPLACQTASHA